MSFSIVRYFARLRVLVLYRVFYVGRKRERYLAVFIYRNRQLVGGSRNIVILYYRARIEGVVPLEIKAVGMREIEEDVLIISVRIVACDSDAVTERDV